MHIGKKIRKYFSKQLSLVCVKDHIITHMHLNILAITLTYDGNFQPYHWKKEWKNLPKKKPILPWVTNVLQKERNKVHQSKIGEKQNKKNRKERKKYIKVLWTRQYLNKCVELSKAKGKEKQQ